MAAYLRPGVYVQENLNPVAPVVGANSTSVAAFIGANARGPLTPQLVTSWSEYLNYYGSWSANNTLALAVFLFFSNGGNQAYVLRVTAGADVAATRTLIDDDSQDTLTLTAVNTGTWGNNVAITTAVSPGAAAYFDLTISYTTTGEVESFTNLTMDSTDKRYAVSIINAQSRFVTAIDELSASTGTDKYVTAVTAQSLAGGANGTAPTSTEICTAVNGFDSVLNSLILNAPGVTESTGVNLLLAYAEARTDVFVVIDPMNDTVANQLTRADAYTQSSYGAVYYPTVTINDPTTTTPGTIIAAANPGGAIVGKYAATDKSRGVFKAPAGLGVRIAGAVSVPSLTNANLDDLNSNGAPVNAIRFISGSGIVIMGARTLKGGYADMYIPVRRSLIFLEKSLVELTQFAVFEPNDSVLYRRVSATVNSFLTNFWAQGGLRGATPQQAFFVLCDSTNNTLSTVESGQVNIQVGVALQRPAEFVIINIGQFDGGSTVTVA